MITLGRSDAILAADIIRLYLDEAVMGFDNPYEHEDEVRDLLEFIEVQLSSMAEEGFGQ